MVVKIVRRLKTMAKLKLALEALKTRMTPEEIKSGIQRINLRSSPKI